MSAVLEELRTAYPELDATERGRGLIQGLACSDPAVVARIVATAFERGLLIETSGRHDHVLKLLPPLVIDEDDLERGLLLLDQAIAAGLGVAPRLTRGDEPLAVA